MANGGRRPGAGRPKGSVNKDMVPVREAFKIAFDKLGGADALAKWAVDNQTEFYKLSSRLIPQAVEGSVQGALEIIHRSE